jgi:hypothetical protein
MPKLKLTGKAIIGVKGSIEKWVNIVAGVGIDDGTHNCALCKLYWQNDCRNCPVKQVAGAIFCKNTPYIEWLHYTRFNGPKVFDARSRELAQAELEFLRSLLPKGK